MLGSCLVRTAARVGLPPAARGFANLTIRDIPKQVLDCEYAARGAVAIEAEKLAAKLAKQNAGEAVEDPVPFKKLVFCNIGNPQAVGGSPLTFHREVLSCMADPSLLEKDVFSQEVKDRASRYLNGVGGRAGGYSHSQGALVFREDCAKFLTDRDGVDTDPEDLFLTDGASGAVKTVMSLAVSGPQDGVLLPIPQYPLYSSTMTLLGGQALGYYLDEATGWSVTMEELERVTSEWKAKGNRVKAIAVINPGNPTGQILSRETMKGILEFAEREKIIICADEVYQDNIHADGKEFVPLRKLAVEIGIQTEMFSFHSVSKGVTGDCGLRGGFVHCHNVDPEVKEQMYKLVSISLCSNILGQATMASVVTLPPVGTPARELFDKERASTRASYKRRATMLSERLNQISGISCQRIEGAVYAFPSIEIKGEILRMAKERNAPADGVYCIELLRKTGIVCVPGSGFGQKPGTHHIRMTILPDEETLSGVVDDLEAFHKKYAS